MRSCGWCVRYCYLGVLRALNHALGVPPCWVRCLSPQGGKALPKGKVFTFPQAPDSFLPGDGSVGIHSPSVFPLSSSSQAYHGLKSDLHHIRGLGTGHRHGSRGAACQNPDGDAGVWGGQREPGVLNTVKISPVSVISFPMPKPPCWTTPCPRPTRQLPAGLPAHPCVSMGAPGCPWVSTGAGTHGPLLWGCRTV